MTEDKTIDHPAMRPGDPEEAGDIQHPRQTAGQDESIAERLERHPDSAEAQLDNALDESMDASDPPAATQPVHHHRPPASSGYDAEAEARRKDG
ncbi:MAG: hypothetical protein WC804_13920 [Sphingomonas sp.]|jgi:hypothetical protein|uniref:hypothetical protein n=1 Tax=Sphingomonas sp. TaxID=28214 RepID=UPI003564162C